MMGYLESIWGCHFQSLRFTTRTTMFSHKTFFGTIYSLILAKIFIHKNTSLHVLLCRDQGQALLLVSWEMKLV